MSITDNIIDLATVLATNTSYMDFEGFANPRDILDCCMEADGRWVWDVMTSGELLSLSNWNPPVDVLRALTLHYVSQAINEGGVRPSREMVTEICGWLAEMLTVRWWSKVTDEQLQEILESPPEVL